MIISLCLITNLNICYVNNNSKTTDKIKILRFQPQYTEHNNTHIGQL